MKKISTNLKNSVAASLLRELISLWNDAKKKLGEAADANIEFSARQLETLVDELERAIKRLSVSSNLEEKDSVRDDILRRLRTILAGYAAFPDSFVELRVAAEKLSAIFDRYGLKTAIASFAEETGLLNSMLKDFEDADATAEAKKLVAVPETIAELKAANEEFSRVSKEFSQNVAANADQRSATVVKKEILNLVNNSLLPYLSAIAVTKKAEYSEFAIAVGKSVDRANATAKSAKKVASADTKTVPAS